MNADLARLATERRLITAPPESLSPCNEDRKCEVRLITSTQSEASITPLARNSDPLTSHAAADQAQAMRHAHHTAILGALRTGAMGKDEIAHFTALNGVQVCRRLPGLQALGLVRPTGRTVRSDTGRQEREWEAV